MRIVMRNQGDADLEPAGQIPFLKFIETAQKPAPAVLTSKANGTVDVAVECAQRFGLETGLLVGLEHFGDYRRAVIEFTSERAQTTGDLITHRYDRDAEIRRD